MYLSGVHSTFVKVVNLIAVVIKTLFLLLSIDMKISVLKKKILIEGRAAQKVFCYAEQFLRT